MLHIHLFIANDISTFWSVFSFFVSLSISNLNYFTQWLSHSWTVMKNKTVLCWFSFQNNLNTRCLKSQQSKTWSCGCVGSHSGKALQNDWSCFTSNFFGSISAEKKPVMAENGTTSQGRCGWREKLCKLWAASLHLLSMPTLWRDKLLQPCTLSHLLSVWSGAGRAWPWGSFHSLCCRFEKETYASP